MINITGWNTIRFTICLACPNSKSPCLNFHITRIRVLVDPLLPQKDQVAVLCAYLKNRVFPWVYLSPTDTFNENRFILRTGPFVIFTLYWHPGTSIQGVLSRLRVFNDWSFTVNSLRLVMPQKLKQKMGLVGLSNDHLHIEIHKVKVNCQVFNIFLNTKFTGFGWIKLCT